MKKLITAAFTAGALLLTAASAEAGFWGHGSTWTKGTSHKTSYKSSKSSSKKSKDKKSDFEKAKKSSKSAKNVKKNSKKSTSKKHSKKGSKPSKKPTAPKTDTNLLLACGGDSMISALSGACFTPQKGTNDKTYFGKSFNGSDYDYLTDEPFGDQDWFQISYVDIDNGYEKSTVAGQSYSDLFAFSKVGLDVDFANGGRDYRSGEVSFNVAGLEGLGDIMLSLKYCNDFQTFLLGDLMGLQADQDGNVAFNFGKLPHGLSHVTFWGTQGFSGPPTTPVSAVPIPGALPLFASALVGGAILRKRKKAQEKA